MIAMLLLTYRKTGARTAMVRSLRLLIVFFALLAMRGASAAEWVFVSDAANDVKIYVDKESITKEKDLRRAWTLMDNLKESYQSAMVLREINCKKREETWLAFRTFSQRMAEGAMVNDKNIVRHPQHVAPDSPSEDVLKYVCSKWIW